MSGVYILQSIFISHKATLMSNYDYLRKHALENIWCSPEADLQYIFKLAKLTKYGGVKATASVWGRIEQLPDQTSIWNVYQIGQVHPLILGLFPEVYEWVSFSETCNKQKMVVDVYTRDGIELPRFQTYYKYNQDKNLIIATRKNSKIPFNFDEDDIFLRVYTNEYFNTLRANQVTDFIYTEGRVPTSIADILAMQTTYNDYASKPGITYVFVNGFKVDAVDIINVKVGDSVEFIYDSTIYKVVDFQIDGLNDFTSTYDRIRKYLLHYVGADNGVIDFQDDIDVFVLEPTGSKHRGIYYHKNNVNALRNVTHRDYSVVIPYVLEYARILGRTQTPPKNLDPNTLYIRLHIRKSGYNRPLVFEANRIHELYKMQDIDIVKAMLGIDSTVPNWRADVLEASGYTRVMQAHMNDVTPELVQEAYGYNAISTYIAFTPNDAYQFGVKKAVDVPYGLQNGATVYEYDADGLLLGWFIHPVGSRYTCFNDTCAKVEIIMGTGGDYLDEYYNDHNVARNPKYSFRVYECEAISGVADNKFVDVTADKTKYSVVDNRIVWTEPNPLKYPMIRTDARFIALDHNIPVSRGILKLTLTSKQKRGTLWSTWAMHVPMGKIDVILNRKSLIRNLDYVVVFPEIYIINKEYLISPETEPQQIHVRMTGFCSDTLQFEPQGDAGFIEHGFLSNNDRFDIRDDKVLRITVDGKMYSRNQLEFSEEHTGVSPVNALNGRPYSIDDIMVPFRSLTAADTYDLRKVAQITDKRVSDYLSMKIPQPPRPGPVTIVDRYKIFSPFINRIIYDLVTDEIQLQDKAYSDRDTIAVCKPYEPTLKFDPTQPEVPVDDRYVIVHPHNLSFVVNLSHNKYRFLQNVVKLYCHGRVNLSPFITVV